MTDDLTRCADGPGNCPRADQCARTLPSAREYALYVYFWFSLPEGQQCSHYVPREAQGGEA